MMTLEEQNKLVLELVQACCGAITPRFRAVWLCTEDPDKWTLGIILEKESSIESEAIEDIVCNFEAFQSGPIPIEVVKLTDSKVSPLPPEGGRLVFLRREEIAGDTDNLMA